MFIENVPPFQALVPRLSAALIAAAGLIGSGNAAGASPQVAARACASADVPARLVSSPAFEVPYIAAQRAASGSVMLKIGLSDNGQLKDAEVAESSGDPALDAEALRVAQASRYAPMVHDCENAASDYFYIVDFPNAS